MQSTTTFACLSPWSSKPWSSTPPAHRWLFRDKCWTCSPNWCSFESTTACLIQIRLEKRLSLFFLYFFFNSLAQNNDDLCFRSLLVLSWSSLSTLKWDSSGNAALTLKYSKWPVIWGLKILFQLTFFFLNGTFAGIPRPSFPTSFSFWCCCHMSDTTPSR